MRRYAQPLRIHAKTTRKSEQTPNEAKTLERVKNTIAAPKRAQMELLARKISHVCSALMRTPTSE